MPDRQQSSDNSNVFLLYHPLTRRTGIRLGQFLGCNHGEQFSWPDTGSYDYVIRWGCRRHVGPGHHEVLNPSPAIRNASNKYDAITQLQDAGIPVPPFTREASDIGVPGNDEAHIHYPVLGRDENHSQGSDIDLIMQDRDIELGGRSHHYVQYIPTAAEFRVQVFDGEVIKVHEKLLQHEADNDDPYVRNNEGGWVFLNPRSDPPDEQLAIDAVNELGLDFGAVDCIRAEGTGEEFILEVNTAPTLDQNNMERYGDAIQSRTNIDSVPGTRAVDWSEEVTDGIGG